MNNYEMKKRVLSLIEEVNPSSQYLTDDPDIREKINGVINQVMFELARYKKIPKFIEMNVNDGDTITFDTLESECGYKIYQIGTISGANYESRAGGTVIKILEDGTVGIDCFVYPEEITDNTKDKAYEFELSPDVLEIMPYGVAADLLKSDVSASYGSIYANRYEQMKQLLDTRYQLSTFTVEGGYNI